ncbi:MAG TPA: ParB N-terminal domain-containing protein, partial [Thiolinea sp.]|nr:ParB N-terminal domain-containing protein [Thiolinea sp.]
MVKKPGLGRGLDVLLSSARTAATQPDEVFLKSIPVEAIRSGSYQPRSQIEPESLRELADSIKAQGLVQPVVV